MSRGPMASWSDTFHETCGKYHDETFICPGPPARSWKPENYRELEERLGENLGMWLHRQRGAGGHGRDPRNLRARLPSDRIASWEEIRSDLFDLTGWLASSAMLADCYLLWLRHTDGRDQ